jgi:hypothetical protein
MIKGNENTAMREDAKSDVEGYMLDYDGHPIENAPRSKGSNAVVDQDWFLMATRWWLHREREHDDFLVTPDGSPPLSRRP